MILIRLPILMNLKIPIGLEIAKHIKITKESYANNDFIWKYR
jgi:hypothetical protein